MLPCRIRHLKIPALWKEHFPQSNHNYITTKPCKMCSLPVKSRTLPSSQQTNLTGTQLKGSATAFLPQESLSLGLCLAIEALSLTFHALGEGEAGSRRRPLPVLGMAEAGRHHPVGRVLQQGIQQPKAICGFHSPKPQNNTCIMPHLKWFIFLLRRL